MAGITSDVATSDFLNLLTIQLKNQDPIEPVNQEQFTAQLAQFSMLEQLENMTGSFEKILQDGQVNQGLGMIGKEATYTDNLTEEIKSGVVDQMFSNDGAVSLLINGERVALDLISGIAPTSEV